MHWSFGMSIFDWFRRDVDAKISKHLAEFEIFGALPENWQQERKNLEKLKRISNMLLSDLVELREKHQDVPEVFDGVIGKLSEFMNNLDRTIGTSFQGS